MPSPLALEVVKSYEDEDAAAPVEKGGYTEDLKAELGTFKSLLDKGDLDGAAVAFEEMVKLCGK